MTKVSSRARLHHVRLWPILLFLPEQEEVVQTLKAESDASNRQIWLCMRAVTSGFAFLSVRVVCVYSRSPLNSQVQTYHISLPKNKPTQPISFTRSTSTGPIRHPIRIGSYCHPARHGGICTLGSSYAKHSCPRFASRANICSHRNCTYVLHAYRTGFDQYRMVELRLYSGSLTPFLLFTHPPGEDKHIAVGINEI
jgi:hypothetical protein